jgi:uncharacterized protein
MKSEDVAAYLQRHPEFFELHAEMLADLYIPHPHGGRAIPISERQILTLRERNRLIEAKLREVIRFGEENDEISEKVHRLALALLRAENRTALLDIVHCSLREDFAVPRVVLRTWTAGSHGAESDAVREFAEKHAAPYCGAHPPQPLAALFGDAEPHARSYSLIPLRVGDTLGVLALASDDPQRFYPEMGTLYLERIGDLVAAALSRHDA